MRRHRANDIQRLKIEQVKIRDERAATNKVYRDIARAESIKDIISSAIVPYDKNDFLNIVQYEGSGHDLIVCLSDLHTGAGIDSAWNKFDKEILKARQKAMSLRYLILLSDMLLRKSMFCYLETLSMAIFILTLVFKTMKIVSSRL